jgi:hypothetical protein
VKSLVKRRKLSAAQKLVQEEIELEEWGTEAQVKVCAQHSMSRNRCTLFAYAINPHSMSAVGNSSD